MAVYPDQEDTNDEDSFQTLDLGTFSPTEITHVLDSLENDTQGQKRPCPQTEVEVEKKKVKLCDKELSEIIEAAEYLCRDVEEASKENCPPSSNRKEKLDLASSSPYIQLAQTPPKVTKPSLESNPVLENLRKVRELHFHLHLEGEGRKVISYEQLDDKTFRICID